MANVYRAMKHDLEEMRRRQHEGMRAALSDGLGPVVTKRDGLRAAQAEAVMPLIGPLLDAWECSSQACREELPELDKQLRRINRAMEDAGA